MIIQQALVVTELANHNNSNKKFYQRTSRVLDLIFSNLETIPMAINFNHHNTTSIDNRQKVHQN